MWTCALCSLTCTLNVRYENLENRGKGLVPGPTSKPTLLLTSTIIMQSFSILRLIVLELW